MRCSRAEHAVRPAVGERGSVGLLLEFRLSVEARDNFKVWVNEDL